MKKLLHICAFSVALVGAGSAAAQADGASASVKKSAISTKKADAKKQEGVVSLKEALASTYLNNPSIKAAQYDLEVVNENVYQAFSGWLPRASASGYYGEQDVNYASGVQTSGDTQNYNVAIEQPIFRGFRTLNAQDQAHFQVMSARSALDAQEQRILLEAVTAYIDLIKDRGVYNLSVENVKVLRQELSSVKSRFNLGETTIADVAQAESRLALAVADQVTAEANLARTEADFESVIRLEPQILVIPGKLPSLPEDLDTAINKATGAHPTVLNALYNKEAAEEQVQVNKGALLPEVSARAEYQDSRNNLFGGDYDYTRYSVSVNVPIYNAGVTYSEVRKAKKDYERARQEYLNVKNEARAEAVSSWKAVETSEAAIKAQKQAVKSAEIAFDGVKKEADLGTRTILDVLDTERELFSRKTDLLRAERDRVVAHYRMLAAVGDLTAQNLQLTEDIYDKQERLEDIEYQLLGF